MPWRRTLLLQSEIALVLLQCWCAGPGSPAGSGREEELKRLVRQDCGSCHGMTLKGGLGRPLLPQTLEHLDADAVANVILSGIPGTPMPPWRGILSAEDALWIAAKLKAGFPQ